MTDGTSSTTAIRATGLEKRYGERVALGPLDLEIKARELVALVGHNGSGKSTFLSICAGLLDPSEGRVTVDGNTVGSIPSRAATSYIPDNPVLYDDLSLREHLEYVARLHGVGSDAWEDRAMTLARRLGLEDRLDDLPTTFSRGLRQKSMIAIGFVRPFSTLLVDEPFVGLDAAGRETLLELIEEAGQAGATVVVATHQLEFVDRTRRLIALRDGSVIHDGPPGVSLAPLVEG